MGRRPPWYESAEFGSFERVEGDLRTKRDPFSPKNQVRLSWGARALSGIPVSVHVIFRIRRFLATGTASRYRAATDARPPVPKCGCRREHPKRCRIEKRKLRTPPRFSPTLPEQAPARLDSYSPRSSIRPIPQAAGKRGPNGRTLTDRGSRRGAWDRCSRARTAAEVLR